MLICAFHPHYQLVYTSFDFSSFSLISYLAKAMLLHAKSIEITTQKQCFLKQTKLRPLHKANGVNKQLYRKYVYSE